MLKLLLFVVVVLIFGLFMMYNHKILSVIGKSRSRSEGLYYKLVGKRVGALNTKMNRSVSLQKGSYLARIDAYFKEIIINLGMARDNVTVVGLLIFIGSVSFCVAVLYAVWSGELTLFFFTFAAIFYLIVVLFRFVSLTRFEKRESEIMDAQDLIAMDIKGGVQNAIVRYQKSFHPNIKPFFEEFLDNISYKGYSFRESMLLLNERLGPSFTDFAQKSILYEEKADKDMDDIFSGVVEVNRYKRSLRYENNQKFARLRLEFLVSFGVIAGYAVFSVSTDAYLANLFANTFLGKFLLIADVVAATAVLAYISSIKAKLL